MLWFGVLGKACLLICGAWAWTILRHDETPGPRRKFSFYLVLGFAFWTLSLFSGEIWSYLGWGIPMVREDPIHE